MQDPEVTTSKFKSVYNLSKIKSKYLIFHILGYACSRDHTSELLSGVSKEFRKLLSLE